jgi:hypothetical protein
MNKQTQFKVTLKRYLNTHYFYSVDSKYVQKFLSLLFCCMDFA